MAFRMFSFAYTMGLGEALGDGVPFRVIADVPCTT